jgi:hypothetical protein
VNAYSYFTDEKIWPRGLPLNEVQNKFPSPSELPTNEADCPIQQGLADENPDVDAVYRLLFPLPVRFSRNRELILGRGSWCPFNSQNTTWWRDAFPLLYLPANCSFRMTDIWRSFVAQRIAHINEWSILFHAPTVWQDRNEHDLMRDFEDEVPGYLLNSSIRASLERLHLQPGTTEIPNNLRICYEAMIRLGAVSAEEMPLLEAWIRDVGRLC